MISVIIKDVVSLDMVSTVPLQNTVTVLYFSHSLNAEPGTAGCQDAQTAFAKL